MFNYQYGQMPGQAQQTGNPMTIGVAGAQPYQSGNPFAIQVAEQGGGFLGAKEEPGASGWLSSKEPLSGKDGGGGGGGMGGIMDMFGGGGEAVDSGAGTQAGVQFGGTSSAMDSGDGGGGIWDSLLSIIGSYYGMGG